MTGDFDANGTPPSDSAEPGDVVAAMASAVDRLRSGARTVFEGMPTCSPARREPVNGRRRAALLSRQA